MILQRIKKNYHNLSTRFNYNFSYISKYKMYERNNFISYDYIILLMTECYTFKKNYFFFLRKKFFKISYFHNFIEEEMFEFIGDTLF